MPPYHARVGDMLRHAKAEGFEHTSIISNGSTLPDAAWFASYGASLDMLGISCDSPNDATNTAIGRAVGTGGARQAEFVRRAAQRCAEHGIEFKVNTVVCRTNCSLAEAAAMAALINEVRPTRWKLFQVLPLAGENTGAEGEKKDVRPLLISAEEFAAWVAHAKSSLAEPGVVKVEDNDTMRSSYVLVDEYGRFLDSTGGGKVPTAPALEVGVSEALRQLWEGPGRGFDKASYLRRDGAFWQDRASYACQ